MTSSLSPLLFKPIYKEKIWGGQALKNRLDKDIPSTIPIGESWEIAGFDVEDSTLQTAQAEGATLRALVRAKPEVILGSQVTAADAFPLLYKFIDANDRLSVQVHPSDTEARENRWGSFGKTEAWYIADAQEDAQIIVGFKEGVSLDDVRDGIRNTTLDELLNFIDISAGDTLFMPAGTVHAILSGTLIYEVQQSSDTTFRLYDWGRVDSTGASRPLHIEESLRVLDMTYHTQHKIPPIVCNDCEPCAHAYRVVCRYFALEEFRFEKAGTITLPRKESFRVVSLLDGTAALRYAHGEMHIHKGQSALIPAALHEVTFEARSATHALLSSVPDIAEEVIRPLRRQGISDERIALLGGQNAKNDILSVISDCA